MNIELKDLFEETGESFIMICPFIGFYTAKYLSELIIKNNIKSKIITRFSRNDFYKQVSSIEGLKLLHNAGANIKAVKNLHAKLYVFDSNSIILGSSNFTNGGLITNLELNVLIEDEHEIISRAIDYYNEIDISINDEYIVTREIIEKEIQVLNSIIDNKRDRTSDYDFGAILLPKNQNDGIERLFSQDNASKNEMTSSWLKFEGFSDDKRAKNTEPLNINLTQQNYYRTHFPKRPIGLKNGDIIFVARNSWDSNEEKTPMVYGYGIVKAFNDNNIATEEEKRINENYYRWPYYIHIENFKYIKGSLIDGVSLLDMYKEIGNNSYPSTRNSNKTYDDLKKMHRQKDKLRITEESKEYLLKNLNEKIKIDTAANTR